jgi:hypothetical protein
MLRQCHALLALTLFVVLFTACRPAQIDRPVMNSHGSSSEMGHSHSDADALFWKKENLDFEGVLISLGHHGFHFHAGDTIEPALTATRDGQPVADEVATVSMIASGDETVLIDEKPMVYEPPTDAEPAHYAQAKFTVPPDTAKFRLRFRLKGVGSDKDWSEDIDVQAHAGD